MKIDTRFLSYQEVAKLTSININTLYTLVRNKKIPHKRLNPRLVRFDENEIQIWLNECSVPTSKEG